MIEGPAVGDGRVGHVWIDDVSVTKVHNDEPPPPSPPTATLSVSAREGRKLPIFTNEPALVKVATHHLDPTRSYRLVWTVTDYWDRQGDQNVFNLDATEQLQTEVPIKTTDWYTVLVSVLGGKHPVQRGTKLALLEACSLTRRHDQSFPIAS